VVSPLACRNCGNTAGPFTADGRCEDCADADTDTSKDDE
jgi:hypothetical protein